jgi:hypothetical protein
VGDTLPREHQEIVEAFALTFQATAWGHSDPKSGGISEMFGSHGLVGMRNREISAVRSNDQGWETTPVINQGKSALPKQMGWEDGPKMDVFIITHRYIYMHT